MPLNKKELSKKLWDPKGKTEETVMSILKRTG